MDHGTGPSGPLEMIAGLVVAAAIVAALAIAAGFVGHALYDLVRLGWGWAP